MSISASTLFHFTSKAEHLINILSNEFRPRFCLEHLKEIAHPQGFMLINQAIPMVCFCDLTLSDMAPHLEFYGNYGIGLTKEWGIRNGLNPVMYISKGSYLNQSMLEVAKHAWESGNRSKCMKIFDFLSFAKPVTGKMYRNRKLVDRYFYDEREWRFVPDLLDWATAKPILNYRLSEDEFLDEVKLAHTNSMLAQHARIPFGPSDIRYVVVSKEVEIEAMIGAIRTIKGKYEPREIDLLITRIVSSEQIMKDF